MFFALTPLLENLVLRSGFRPVSGSEGQASLAAHTVRKPLVPGQARVPHRQLGGGPPRAGAGEMPTPTARARGGGEAMWRRGELAGWLAAASLLTSLAWLSGNPRSLARPAVWVMFG